jgi:ABC-type multidrug transport system permease subunit
MTAFFRLLGHVTPSLFLAQQIQNVFLQFLIMYTGFIIPYEKMPPWFQWIFWINPLAYRFFFGP